MISVIITGGIGKCVAFSALIPKIVEKYGEFNLFSPWPDIFHGVAGVRRSLDINIEYGYEDYFKNNDRYNPEPYNQNDFFKKKIHLIEGFAREFGLEYDPDSDFAIVPSTFPSALARIQEIKKQGKFIVVQFMGGNQAMNGKPNDKAMTKDYPQPLIERTIALFKEVFPDINIVNYGLPFEWNIQGTISAADLPYTAAPYLLAESETYIAVDSSLQHFSACQGVNKSGVVIWGATSPVSFGYKHNINLTAECTLKDQHCTRPYFQHTSDIVGKGMAWTCPSKSCINVQPEVVVDGIKEILSKKTASVGEPAAKQKKATEKGA